MLTQIRSKKGLPASRLEDFIEQMPKGCLSIFKVNDWRQPWGFGIGNGLEAGQLYKDAMITLDMADTYDFEDDWSLNDEDSDVIVIAFKLDNSSIIWQCARPCTMQQYILKAFTSRFSVGNTVRVTMPFSY
jgi:hypothetical protein